jgi:hypothetical protein
MKLKVDVRRFLASAEPSGPCDGTVEITPEEVDVRNLPWADGFFAAIELDDLPEPGEWALSGPALNECRRILRRNGLIELRTRRKDGKEAQATQKESIGKLTRLLQNHKFDVVSVDAVEDEGSLISAMALRGDGPEDRFEDAVNKPATHVTMHGPMLDSGDDATANRALAISLDARGVKVRVRVIFDVLDALFLD